MPPEAFAKIPLDDLTLTEAYEQVDDPSWFDQTLPLVLFHFSQFTVADYWSLTVGEHRALVAFVEGAADAS